MRSEEKKMLHTAMLVEGLVRGGLNYYLLITHFNIHLTYFIMIYLGNMSSTSVRLY